MNILVIGVGSIGKRHLSNLVDLGHQVSVVSSKRQLDEPFQSVQVYENIDDALASQSFDAAFICSPTAFHAATLMALLEQQVPNIYVEKPVSHDSSGIAEIVGLAERGNAHVVVGYDLHFEPGFAKVQSLLKNEAIGKLVSVNAFAGQWLPQWRPYEDHRNGMSAKIETGGGVLLDLIHETDYLYSLVGSIQSVCCHVRNTGALGIATEESADLLYDFDSGVSGVLHLDYLQPELRRYAVFTGTGGVINWNIAERFVECVKTDEPKEIFTYTDAERNDRFKAIVKTFLDNKQDERLVNLQEGLKSLQVVLAAKRSAEENRVVHIKEIQF